MSASREKKKRQELLASGGVDPKAAREAEAKAAARKTNILYGTLGIVFVLVAAGLLLYNSNILTRSRTAVTVDGEKYSVGEVSYYYQQAYQSFINSENGSYMTSLGMLDTSQPLSSQNSIYGEDQTWADYFKEQAVENIRFVHAATKAAKAEGMELDDEDTATLQSNIDSFQSSAASAGYSYSGYVSAVYGANVTTSIFENCLKDQLLAGKYASAYRDSLSFTEDEILNYYNENQNSYDIVDGSYVTISATPEKKTDADGNEVDPTEEETAAALEAARETAQTVLDAYQSGEDVEAMAEADDSFSYYGGKDLTYSGGVAADWLFDSAREAGNAEILENDDATYLYVAQFNGRQRMDYANTYDVRHILITADSLDLAEGEEATDEQMKAEAERILQLWKDGDATEESFAELANEYSQDGGSNTNGGLYKGVSRGQMIADFEDWCYTEGRKSGDTGIIYGTNGNYEGYHIMYFVGYGDEAYWHAQCKTALLNDAYGKWEDDLVSAITAEVDEKVMATI